MLSYFTVCAEDSIFEINEQEWNSAIKEHPELDESQNQMSFFNRTASAWIEPGKDCYFNNEDILYQFERLFKLLKFKKAYENFEVEILVDNARTHTSKLYDLNNLNKHSSIKSSFYETIEYMENNENKVIECHFMDPNDGLKKSKSMHSLDCLSFFWAILFISSFVKTETNNSFKKLAILLPSVVVTFSSVFDFSLS